MDKAFSAIAGTLLGAYLIAVVVKGNGKALTTEISKDAQYLEFLAAIYILYMLHKSKFGGELIDLLVTTAVMGVLIKMAAQSDTNFTGTLSKFAKGEISMTETASTILGLK